MSNPDWPDWGALFLAHTEDELVAAIVDVLRAGTPSRMFLDMLADMIDADRAAKDAPPCDVSPYVLRIMRSRQGNPKRGADLAVAWEMHRLVEIEKCDVKVAIGKVQKKFGETGNGRAKCLEALKIARYFSKGGWASPF
jgi:hypothetical protein